MPSCILGHYEFPPYNPETLRSVYHVRSIDVFKLKQVSFLYQLFFITLLMTHILGSITVIPIINEVVMVIDPDAHRHFYDS